MIFSGIVRHIAIHISFEIATDLIIQTLPNKVKLRFSASLNTRSVFVILSSKFNLKQSLVLWPIYILKYLIGFWGHLILQILQLSCLCLYEPIHRPSHFVKFNSIPAICPNNSRDSNAFFKSRVFFRKSVISSPPQS